MSQQEIANSWTGEDCYLDGNPAMVSGRLLPFGQVRTMDLSQSVEFCWSTIDRVMTFGGRKFKS